MNLLLLLASAVILPIMVLAAPSSQRTSDDDTDSSASSETDVIATNAQIQLVNKAKSSDPKERLAAVSRIRGLLWNGAIDEVAIAQFVSIGVLPVLVNCLKSTDDKLLVEAAQALKSIAHVKSLAVIEAGALPLLVKLLKSPNLEVCKCTVDVFSKIAWWTNASESKIVEAGAVPLLVKLLQSPDMEVCKKSARALTNITAASPELALAVVKAGAGPLLVKLLQSPNMELCENTAWALSTIAADKAREVVEAGALPLLVKLLQYPNMEVCKESAWALTNITAASPELALAVVKAGAVPLLVKLLQSPNMELCEITAWALKNIAAASDDLALAVIKAGGLPPLVKLLQSSNTEVCTQASLTIGKIIEKFPDLNGCCIHVEHIQIMMENDFVAPFCNLLGGNDKEITLKVLDGIKKALKNAPNKKKLVELIDECEGLDKIKQLKTKERKPVLKMIEKIQSSKGDCVVCCDEKIQTAFFPCGHACACQECAIAIEDKCPICRQSISNTPRIYLS